MRHDDGRVDLGDPERTPARRGHRNDGNDGSDDLDTVPAALDNPVEAPPDFFAAGPPPSRGRQVARAMATRWFFGGGALVCALTALIFGLLPATQLSGGLPPGARWAMVAGFAALTLGALAALRLPVGRAEPAMAVLALAAVAVITHSAWALGWGLGTPGLGFLALLVCFVGTLCPRWYALAVAGVSALALIGLAVLQATTSATPSELALRLGVHVVLLGAGLAGGLTLSRVLAGYAQLAAEREQRFRGLLGLAADAYWEIDSSYRLVSATLPRDDGLALEPGQGLGELPWQLPNFGCAPDALDQTLADLDARHPFRDLPVTWRDDSGQTQHLLVSGEPRFDERGAFTGYWGVARNVSADHLARQALAATETRYQDLFTCIPSPLVMHRRGRVVDANPATLALLGLPELERVIGTDFLQHFEPGESRERVRRRLDQLDTLPPGEPLPVSEFRLVGRGGRLLVVRATGVRVEFDGEPAVLSIFVDDTDRRAAEDAVRRSETLLSHLVASSPDVITLTELDSGRYVMVNQTFERVLGWSAAEVSGRTSIEVGIWRHVEDRVRFVEQLRVHGRVSDLAVDFMTRGGQPVSMQVSGAHFTLDRREYLVINARDVTASERARLEREAILENTSLGIAVTRDRRFVMANPAFEAMYGWPRGGLLGQSGRVVWASDEDYGDVGRVVGPALARGEAIELDRPAQRRDGSRFLARIVGKAIDPALPAGGGTIWIVEDVTERRQVAEDLERARDEAEAASRAKSAFLANTSHELRTPLNGMLGLAQLARAPDLDEPRRRQYLDQIVDCAQSLAEILSDILDLAKIEAGRLQTEHQTFDLHELLHVLQRGYTTLAQARGLTLTLEITPGVERLVSGDLLRVRQILSNYLTNALKFTEHGSVRLRVGRLPEGPIRFEVHDSGPGIDETVQARLFRPFTQADESTTRRFGGTGLGLSICRQLAHLMGGEVGVASRPGEGSCFWAHLPLAPADAAADAHAAAPAAPESLGPARVLLAEDNPVNLLIATAMLERWGIEVEPAADGREAVAAVHAAVHAGRPFDAVLMDLQMPVMSGYEATRALRAEFDAQQLPIVALTAAALVTEREQALAAGMDAFLTKPIDADRLRATLARVLAGVRGRAH